MITAIVGPDEFNSLKILEQKLPHSEVNFVVLINLCKWWPMFAETALTFCNRERLSFVCFHAHYGKTEQPEKAAIMNGVLLAERLVAFMQSGDTNVVRIIAEFKKAGKPVQIIRVGEKNN